MRRRLVIIGLDGVSYELLKDLADKGILPNTKILISKSIFKKMTSSIPEVSNVAWSSIITGKNPAEHGIFGFTDVYPNSYKLRFPNYSDLREKSFWENLQGFSIIINVPGTYPVREMRGIHISGFVSVELEKSVWPKDLVDKLKELDYRLDVNTEIAYTSLDLFLEDLDKTLNSRCKLLELLWNKYDWDIFMFVFTGTDRLLHFLFSAYQDSSHKYHNSFLEHFKKIDRVIGKILDRMDKEDLLIMLSDHGFERLRKDVYISYVLKKEGFLKFIDTTEITLENLDSSTKAFVLDPARIYINLKEKFPRGNVTLKDKEKIIRDLIEIFESLEIDGEKIIKKIYRKEEIYKGPYLESAPDLILMGNKGFNLKANIKAENFLKESVFTGKHTQDNAFLIFNKDSIFKKDFEYFDVSEVGKFINKILTTL